MLCNMLTCLRLSVLATVGVGLIFIPFSAALAEKPTSAVDRPDSGMRPIPQRPAL